MEDSDALIRVVEGLVTAAIEICSPILQLLIPIDNFTAAFDAYKIGIYQPIMRSYVLMQEILDKLLVQCS
jgi:hypothetical protein